MTYPRYFVEIDRGTREVMSAHIITFNAQLESGKKLTSISDDQEMLEVFENDVSFSNSKFPDIVGYYRLDLDNKLERINI